jgi:thioredoxin-like negative regulator of GroEL
MNTITVLSAEDFTITKDSLTLVTFQEPTLVFFYSTKCEFCYSAIPVIRGISSKLPKIRTTMVNVTHSPQVVAMAKQTKQPIEYVPLIYFFNHHRPLFKFSGTITEPNLMEFLQYALSQKPANATLSQPSAEPSAASEPIPSYSLATPYTCEDGVCYLNYDDAYTKA